MSAYGRKCSLIYSSLDSDERNNPPSKFAAVYQRASTEGFLLTCHCDIDQPNTLEHIRQALLELQVDRIGK